MKTRRIYLQPGESVEVINQYGTSMLKAVAKFNREQPVVVIYEQPDVLVMTPLTDPELCLTDEPNPDHAEIRMQHGLL